MRGNLPQTFVHAVMLATAVRLSARDELARQLIRVRSAPAGSYGRRMAAMDNE
jgi:hypothetical protein